MCDEKLYTYAKLHTSKSALSTTSPFFSFTPMQNYILLKANASIWHYNISFTPMQNYILLKGQITKDARDYSRLETYNKIYLYVPFLLHRVCFRRWCCLLTSSSTLRRRKFPDQLPVQDFYSVIISFP